MVWGGKLVPETEPPIVGAVEPLPSPRGVPFIGQIIILTISHETSKNETNIIRPMDPFWSSVCARSAAFGNKMLTGDSSIAGT